MATNITSWSIVAVDPDGANSPYIAAVSSVSVPPLITENVDWFSIGQRVKLEMTVTLTGNFPDGTPCQVPGAVIRYNPALFTEQYSPFYPALTYPSGGYSVQLPSSSYVGAWPMALANFGFNKLSNENGTCEVEITSATVFTITHVFLITADMRGYMIGRALENRFRLTKTSFDNPREFDTSVESVFSDQKSLNAYITIKKDANVVYTPELMIISDSYYFGRQLDPSEDAILDFSFQIERASNPGVAVDELSVFEDSILHIELSDPSGYAASANNIFTVLMFVRNLETNNSTFEDDYELASARIIHAPPPNTSQIAGAIYNPAVYSMAGTSIVLDVTIKALLLDATKTYEFFVLSDLSSLKAWQQPNRTGIIKAGAYPEPVDFSIEGALWTRNGANGEVFSIKIGERSTATLTASIAEYDAGATNPAYADFATDCIKVELMILDVNNEIVFKHFMTRQPNQSFPINDLYLGFTETITEMNFYLKEFRIPYTNFQGLMNWLGQTYTFRWSLYFQYYFPVSWQNRYDVDLILVANGYENQEPSPAVYDVKFLNSATGMPLSNWCEEQTVVVQATIDPGQLGAIADTFIEVRVDRFPLGVELFNDNAAEEQDSSQHLTPSFVIFSERLSDLVSGVPVHPGVDFKISFTLDVSEMDFQQKWRVFVHAYNLP